MGAQEFSAVTVKTYYSQLNLSRAFVDDVINKVMKKWLFVKKKFLIQDLSAKTYPKSDQYGQNRYPN